jgi:protein-S-isoprenylcysteine O-methyltransferase Ste14
MRLWVFLIITIILTWFSRRSVLKPRTHGFYRFIAWEAIALLVLLNYPVWFSEPFSWHQIVAWILLFTSIPVAALGFRHLRQFGQPEKERQDQTLLEFEKTTQLVTSGIYGFIRHPLYLSLIMLALGVYFKQPTWIGTLLAAVVILALTITARIEEHENLAYFGEAYRSYISKTKMFIPYLF